MTDDESKNTPGAGDAIAMERLRLELSDASSRMASYSKALTELRRSRRRLAFGLVLMGVVGLAAATGTVLAFDRALSWVVARRCPPGLSLAHPFDTLGFLLGADWWHIKAFQRMRMFLMYRPTGGIWVTLARIDYYWSGEAIRDGNRWSMPETGDWTINPPAEPAFRLPIWSRIFVSDPGEWNPSLATKPVPPSTPM